MGEEQEYKHPELPEKLVFEGQGPLGFEQLTHFSLQAYAPETPFFWLRSDTEPDTAFLVMEPGYFIEDYSFELGDETLKELGITTAEQVGVLVLLSIPENPLEMTANLLGPLVFHREHQRCKQVVLQADTYPLKYPVFQEVEDAGSHP